MKFFNTKPLTVPLENATKIVDTVQTWTVQWESRYGQFGHDTRKEFEIFTNEEDAKDFVTALKNAFKLIRHTSGNEVNLKKN
jgi:hypothetical protein